MSKVWRRGPRDYVVFNVESGGAEISSLDQVRHQAVWYSHAVLRQGHTQRGQVLGSSDLSLGRAKTIGFDRYTPAGRMSVDISRISRSAYDRASPDEVTYGIAPEVVLLRGKTDITARASAARVLHLDFSSSDSWNLGAAIGIQWNH
jgi:hypothetical protein